MYLEADFLEDWKSTSLRVRSSGSTLCRNNGEDHAEADKNLLSDSLHF